MIHSGLDDIEEVKAIKSKVIQEVGWILDLSLYSFPWGKCFSKKIIKNLYKKNQTFDFGPSPFNF